MANRHHIIYDDDKRAATGNLWPCWRATGHDHDEHDRNFRAVAAAAERHARAVAIFEKRMGFGWTDDYEGSREWSDALAEAYGHETQRSEAGTQ